MWPNPQLPGDLVTFTEEILNGKLHFLCSAAAGKTGAEYSIFFKRDLCQSITEAGIIPDYKSVLFCFKIKHKIKKFHDNVQDNVDSE